MTPRSFGPVVLILSVLLLAGCGPSKGEWTSSGASHVPVLPEDTQEWTFGVVKGQIITAPGSIKPHAKGTAEFYALATKEGGRKTPFGPGYRPQFFFGTTNVTGTVAGVQDADLVLPGDRATLDFELLKPVGVEIGMRFAVREGGKTVGAGVVTAVA